MFKDLSEFCYNFSYLNDEMRSSIDANLFYVS